MPAEIFICYIPTFLYVSEGKFKSFGLSNYAAWEVVSISLVIFFAIM